MNTLYWHDYETWGVNPKVDKPCQFAGLRTNEDLEPIGSPLVIYAKPSLDVLPSPEACFITGITPSKALERGVSEPEFIDSIHRELSVPGTCGVGYNSLRFDDEVTRFCLYRNFHDPYAREWRDGNSRWDIIDMVRLVSALRPDTLNWPVDASGNISFRLEALTTLNNIEHGAAHDALSDVLATIALAKLIKQRQPKLYDYVYALRNKRRVSALIDCQNQKPLVHISSKYSAERHCCAVIMPIMVHPLYKNRIIAYDLSVDPSTLLNLDASTISKRLYTKTSELPSGVRRLPLKEIHLNRSPVVCTLKLLSQDDEQRLGLDLAQSEKHWQILRNHDQFKSVLSEVYSAKKERATPVDAEQALYDGFISARDRAISDDIRRSTPENLMHFSKLLKDDRLKALLFRYRARHFEKSLTADERQRWHTMCRDSLLCLDVHGTSRLEHYFSEVKRLSSQPTITREWVDQLEHYGNALCSVLNVSDLVG